MSTYLLLTEPQEESEARKKKTIKVLRSTKSILLRTKMNKLMQSKVNEAVNETEIFNEGYGQAQRDIQIAIKNKEINRSKN